MLPPCAFWETSDLWDGSVTLALEVMEVGQGLGIVLATLHHEYNSSLLIGLLKFSPFEVSGYVIDEILSQVYVCCSYTCLYSDT